MTAASAKRRPRRSFTQLTWKRGQAARAMAAADDSSLPKSMGYEVLSYLIAGILAYGGIGWLIGHYTHISILFPIGMLVGLALSIGWIIYRYGVKGDRYGVTGGGE